MEEFRGLGTEDMRMTGKSAGGAFRPRFSANNIPSIRAPNSIKINNIDLSLREIEKEKTMSFKESRLMMAHNADNDRSALERTI